MSDKKPLGIFLAFGGETRLLEESSTRPSRAERHARRVRQEYAGGDILVAKINKDKQPDGEPYARL